MKLFTEDERYTPEGLAVNNEISAAIRPIFKKYLESGAKIRDLSLIIHGLAVDFACTEVLARGVKRRKLEDKP